MKFTTKLAESQPSEDDLRAFRRLAQNVWGEIGMDVETPRGKREDYAVVLLDRLYAGFRRDSKQRELLDRTLAAAGGQDGLVKIMAKWL